MKKRIVISEWHRENLTTEKTCLLMLQKDLDSKSVCENEMLNKISNILKLNFANNNFDTNKIAKNILDNLL